MVEEVYLNIFIEGWFLAMNKFIELKESNLSRINYISELGKKDYEYFLNDIDALNVNITFYTLLTNLEELEKLELCRIIISYNIDIQKKFIDDNYDLFLAVIKTTKKIHINTNVLKEILLLGIKLDNIDYINFIFDLISNILENDHVKMTLESFYAKFNNVEYKEELFSYKLYTLISLHSIFFDVKSSKVLWVNFLNAFFEYNVNFASKLFVFKDHIKSAKISNNLTSIILTMIKEGIIISKGRSSFEENFIMDILILISSEELSKVKSKDGLDFQKIIKDFSTQNNLEYLNWSFDGASLYPDENTCYNNIVFNDRMVLKKGNKFLIRGHRGIFTSGNISEENIKIGETVSFFEILSDYNTSLSNLEMKLNRINSLNEALNYFKKILSHEFNYNIFEKGTLTDDNDDINFLYSKHDEKLVISNEIYDFNKVNIILQAFKKLKESIIKINLITDDISMSTFLDMCIPSSVQKNPNELLIYVDCILNSINEINIKNHFHLHEVIFLSLNYYYFEKNKGESKFKYVSIIQALQQYLNQINNNNYDIENILLFSSGKFNESKYNLKDFLTFIHLNIMENSLEVANLFQFCINDLKDLHDIESVVVRFSNFNNNYIQIDNEKYTINEIIFRELFLNEEVEFFITPEKKHKIISCKHAFFNKNTKRVYLMPNFFEDIFEIINGKTG